MTDDREAQLAQIARLLKEKGMTPAELLDVLKRLPAVENDQDDESPEG